MPSDKGLKQRPGGRGDSCGPISAQINPPRKLTAVACIDCRKRKRKCNGGRPSCSACQARGLDCLYDVVEGATRTEDLKQRVQALTARIQTLDVFVNKLRHGTDNEASAYLAQLRLGDRVDVILDAEADNGIPSGSIDDVRLRIKRLHSSTDEESEAMRLLSNYGSGNSSDTMSVATTINSALFNDNQSFASMSVASGKVSPDSHLRMHQNPPWDATPLFVDIDPHHPLYEGGHRAEIGEAAWDCETGSSLFDHTTCAHTISTTGSERQAKAGERWKTRNRLFIERVRGDETVVVSSHLYRGIADLPLSAPVELLRSSHPEWPTPAWAITSLYQRDGDVMASVYTDFVNEKKSMIENGMAPEQIFGTSPEVEALTDEGFFRQASSLSRWTAQHANSFGVPSLTCRSAVMWLNWHLMRWLIHPTPETYAAIPAWYRPTPYQLLYPHPIHIDFYIWPLLRDATIQRLDLQSQTRYWYTDVGKTIDCNWHGTLENVLCYDGSTGRLTLNSVFVQHLSDLNNWTIGPVIQKYMPDADLFVQIKYGTV